MYKGIDVSKWQGTIDWGRVKNTGVDFALVRATFASPGRGYKNDGYDSKFTANIEGAYKAGIPVGVYHYCYANTMDKAKAEAAHFLKTIDGYKYEYPVIVDIEDKCMDGLDVKTLTDMVVMMLEEIEKAGYFAMVYANKSWFTSRLDDSRLKPYAHWVAQWGDKCTYPGAYGIWQYTNDGAVNGIAGRVDMDYAYVNYPAVIKAAGLNGYGKVTPEPIPQTKPAPAPSKPATPDIYTAQPGDTLSGIASKFNIPGGFQALAKLNGIANPNLIQPGQKIKLHGSVTAPQAPVHHTTYIVVKGDSLWKIAHDFHTTVDNLARLNGIKNPSLIYAGQKIIIK